MGDRRQVHDGGAAFRRPPDRGGVKQVIAVGAVEAGDLVAKAPQVSGYRGADVPRCPVTRMRTDP